MFEREHHNQILTLLHALNADCDVLAWVRHHHVARAAGVLELHVVALAADALPALGFESVDDGPGSEQGHCAICDTLIDAYSIRPFKRGHRVWTTPTASPEFWDPQ